MPEVPAVHTIETRTHGRYLVEPPRQPGPVRWLMGFHGQGETAAVHLEALQALGADRGWGLVSVQGLNRYYTRAHRVVAGWMTREDRELAIADTVAYVGQVVSAVLGAHGPADRLVYCGFSQGAGTAYRAAAFAGHPSDALIVLAGDVPPDVAPVAGRLPPVLLGRGSTDGWYTDAKATADLDVLRSAGASVDTLIFDGGHEWHPAFIDRARAFLAALDASDAPP